MQIIIKLINFLKKIKLWNLIVMNEPYLCDEYKEDAIGYASEFEIDIDQNISNMFN